MDKGNVQLVARSSAVNTDANDLSTLLSIDGNWRNSRDGTIARYKGIKTAKDYALKETNSLLTIGRYLSYAVVFVSAIHIWESVARIAPANVPMLHLHAMVYYIAALLFTILIDITAVFILKARTVLAYTGAKGSNAIWFFYFVTALLNAAFIAGNSPDATDNVRSTLIALLGNSFIVLLPITIPIALWSIEESNKKLEAGKISLTVDIATLDGMIDANLKETGKETAAQDNRTLIINHVLEKDTYPDKVLPALTCAKCNALLPTTGDAKKDRGVWLSTHRFGCKVCKSN